MNLDLNPGISDFRICALSKTTDCCQFVGDLSWNQCFQTFHFSAGKTEAQRGHGGTFLASPSQLVAEPSSVPHACFPHQV